MSKQPLSENNTWVLIVFHIRSTSTTTRSRERQHTKRYSIYFYFSLSNINAPASFTGLAFSGDAIQSIINYINNSQFNVGETWIYSKDNNVLKGMGTFPQVRKMENIISYDTGSCFVQTVSQLLYVHTKSVQHIVTAGTRNILFSYV